MSVKRLRTRHRASDAGTFEADRSGTRGGSCPARCDLIGTWL